MNHLLCGLAANAALPSELVDRLIARADDDIAGDLARRTDLTHAQAVELASRVAESAPQLAYGGRLTADDIDPLTHPRAALALLEEGNGREEWTRLFAADPVVERRERLAACPGLPADVAETLAADPDVRVVAELARWTTTSGLAARLATHPHTEVRRGVAANEATPPSVLARLIDGAELPPARWCPACDGSDVPFGLPPGASCDDGSHEDAVTELWRTAVQNPTTPAEAVAGFADHPSLLLRLLLAARPDLPSAVRRRLAADPCPAVRADLARNPAVDEALIRRLAADEAPDVLRGLAHHPRVPLDVLARLTAATRIGPTLLPRIADASAAEVESLARSPHPELRMLLAERRDLPPAVRDALAADTDAKVVRSLAPHPGLSEAQLGAILDRHGGQVAARVAANPDATPALLERLSRAEPPVRKALREIAGHRHATAPALLACLADARARPTAAGRPALPPPVVVELLSDPDWQVVEAAAANPSLPLAVMTALVRDV
ncbi:hypothetical protein [Streptomyces lateritius]|uniref:hypothetical protein n=1 Tax=Streptomyces lateritius TaxID=67313 RepID=UPI00167AC59D|nr:hypothetical protein [Streptomyces lateritius]GGT72097.1 hypothetical protein GCM10010272_14020 [Streptomyces lateritius]